MAFTSTLLARSKKYWGAISFTLIFLFVELRNFPWQGWLVGWDALVPELNILLNLRYAVQAGWQAHYGTGALIGHGYAATLPHVLLAGVLKLLLPVAAVRPVTTLLYWYLGGLGMYVLLRSLLQRVEKSTHSFLLQCVAAMGALFYAFNLATTQIFYHPLEAFSVQFALYPWLFWIVEKIFRQPQKQYWMLLFATTWLGSVQGFIPSNFLAFGLVLSMILAGHILLERTRNSFWTALKILAVTLASNAYWLFVFLFYTVAKNTAFLESYQNRISTPEFLAKSAEYGSLTNVIQMRSFFLEGNLFGEQVYAPWLEYLRTYPIGMLYMLFFALILLGMIVMLRKQYRFFRPYGFSLLVVFLMLATRTPIAQQLNQFLYALSPLYEQAFRTPFTKVGIAYVAVFTIVLSQSLWWILARLSRLARFLAVGLYAVLLVLILLPHLQGHSFYRQLKVTVPDAYQEILHYFGSTSRDAYVADLPLGCNDGWYSYDWGYTGSGFFWYGVEQPFLSRAFDVWNPYTESYYWQAERSVREGNFNRLDEIFEKYQVGWVLIDPNLEHCRNNQSLHYLDDLEQFFMTHPSYTEVLVTAAGVTEPVKVYERTSTSLPEVTREVGPLEPVLDADYLYSPLSSYVDAGVKTEGLASLFSQKKNLADFVSIENTAEQLRFKLASGRELLLPFAAFDTSGAIQPTACVGHATPHYEAVLDETKSISEVQLFSTSEDGCITFSLNAQDLQRGGFISFDARNIQGLPFRITIFDQVGHVYVDRFVEDGTNTYFIPPVDQEQSSVEVRLLNRPLGVETVNEMGALQIGIVDILGFERLYRPETLSERTVAPMIINRSGGTVKTTSEVLLVLPASYDTSWIAIARASDAPWWQPASYRSVEHLRFNGWANAWKVDCVDAASCKQVIHVLYWPQLVALFGYMITAAAAGLLLLYYRRPTAQTSGSSRLRDLGFERWLRK